MIIVVIQRVERIDIVADNVEESAVFLGSDFLLHAHGTRHQAHHVLEFVVAVKLYLLVDGIALDEVLLEDRSSPTSERGRILTVHPIANGYYHIQVVIRNFTKNTTMSLCSNLCIFCTSWILIKFLRLVNITNMSNYRSSIYSKQLRHLALSQPHCIILQLHVQLYASVLRTVYFYGIVHHFNYQRNNYINY